MGGAGTTAEEKTMRTREMRLSDYGILRSDEEKLEELIKNIDPENKKILVECAKSCAPGIEMAVVQNLTGKRMGYRTINKQSEIPVGEDDFYGYSRKTLAMFWRQLKLLGRWEE